MLRLLGWPFLPAVPDTGARKQSTHVEHPMDALLLCRHGVGRGQASSEARHLDKLGAVNPNALVCMENLNGKQLPATEYLFQNWLDQLLSPDL